MQYGLALWIGKREVLQIYCELSGDAALGAFACLFVVALALRRPWQVLGFHGRLLGAAKRQGSALAHALASGMCDWAKDQVMSSEACPMSGRPRRAA